MRICKKCGSDFPIMQKVDGKKRNLGNRKFCLKCSPFGKHNTKKDPALPSKTHSRNTPYSKWTLEEKQEAINKRYQQGIDRKKKIIEMKGGGCQKCGYNKCLRVLTFHHRDPATKSFCLTSREIGGFSWKSIIEEVEKCDLLCYNCHMEIEYEINKSKYDRNQYTNGMDGI